MTVEVAREWIKSIIINGYKREAVFTYRRKEEALTIAIDMLEKQIEKKPKNKLYLESDNMYVGQCPNCGFGMNSEMNYCDLCGQKLDWSEE